MLSDIVELYLVVLFKTLHNIGESSSFLKLMHRTVAYSIINGAGRTTVDVGDAFLVAE